MWYSTVYISLVYHCGPLEEAKTGNRTQMNKPGHQTKLENNGRNVEMWKYENNRMCVSTDVVDSKQWRLFIKMTTDWQVSEAGDTCRPAAGSRSCRSVQIEWISAWSAHLGFPVLLSVPHLLAHEIVMNRRHWDQQGLEVHFLDTYALHFHCRHPQTVGLKCLEWRN